tara:strand:+ start:27 stop:398 length:372 start_codon:yes stop_codon:yes gene_type:complete
MEQLINNDYNKNLTRQLIQKDKDNIEQEQNDKFLNLNNKITDIKEQMIDNIEETINRKQNIDVIIQHTQNLEGHSLKFNNEAIKLKNRQCWSMWRCRIYIIIILLSVIFFVILISCKFNLKHC